MRRLLLSGLGLTLGLGTPALGQTPTRSAQFGRPISLVAAPASPAAPTAPSEGPVEGYDPNEGVTPAGLFSRSRPTTSTSQQMPLTPSMVPSVGPQGTVVGTPVVGSPVMGSPVGTPGFGAVYGAPPAGVPGFTMQPMPTSQVPMPMPSGPMGPMGEPKVGPSVTEVRDGAGAKFPPPLASGAAIVAGPTAMLPGGAAPVVDDPFFCGPGGATGPTGLGACGHFVGDKLNRLFGGGIFEPRTGASRYWASGEYLMWWTTRTHVPILATSTFTPGSDALLSDPGAFPILGGGKVGDNLQNGIRVGLGWWFSDCQVNGIDARLFFLEQNGGSQTVTSDVFPTITRPFFNLNQQIPFGETVAFPGFSVGGVSVETDTTIWGAEANWRRRIDCGFFPCARIDGLAGFRYMNLKDNVTISEQFIRNGTAVPATGLADVTSGIVTDQFRTENNFYGGQVGFNAEVRRGRFYVDTRATVALGTVNQSAEIYGSQNLVMANGAWLQSQGGLLAVPGANIGTYSQNKFAVMPEVGMNFGYHITPHLRAFVGFNFLYLSSVLRAGEVINTNLDVTRIPNFPLVTPVAPLAGTAQPQPLLKTTDFTAKGINFGLAYAW